MARIDEHGEFMYPFVRSPYNYDMDRVSRETGLVCLDGVKAAWPYWVKAVKEYPQNRKRLMKPWEK